MTFFAIDKDPDTFQFVPIHFVSFEEPAHIKKINSLNKHFRQIKLLCYMTWLCGKQEVICRIFRLNDVKEFITYVLRRGTWKYNGLHAGIHARTDIPR